jgi:hypothetical protein
VARTLIYKECASASNGNRTREIYWDTSIRDVIYITVPNTDTCSTYHLPQGALIDSWCEGTTKKEVFSVWDGVGRPPKSAITLVETPHSASCSVANPCGLKILDVQVVPTGTGVFRATVIANQTTGVEYSLNAFVDVQDSPIFENLMAGSFEAKVRTKR